MTTEEKKKAGYGWIPQPPPTVIVGEADRWPIVVYAVAALLVVLFFILSCVLWS